MANRSNINFNSIKVRLEQATLYAREEVSHFNSIKVRLERKVNVYFEDGTEISIP